MSMKTDIAKLPANIGVGTLSAGNEMVEVVDTSAFRHDSI